MSKPISSISLAQTDKSVFAWLKPQGKFSVSQYFPKTPLGETICELVGRVLTPMGFDPYQHAGLSANNANELCDRIYQIGSRDRTPIVSAVFDKNGKKKDVKHSLTEDVDWSRKAFRGEIQSVSQRQKMEALTTFIQSHPEDFEKAEPIEIMGKKYLPKTDRARALGELVGRIKKPEGFDPYGYRGLSNDHAAELCHKIYAIGDGKNLLDKNDSDWCRKVFRGEIPNVTQSHKMEAVMACIMDHLDEFELQDKTVPLNLKPDTDFPSKAITYELVITSRLGDNIEYYIRAKWISHKTGLPLVVKPFPHWEKFKFSHTASHVLPKGMKTIPMKNVFNADVENTIRNKNGVHELPWRCHNVGIDWSNESFRLSLLDDLSSPNGMDNFAPLRPDCKNIAIHFREGGSWDPEITKYNMPLRFPSIDYYTTNIDFISKEYPNENLHFQIFTDAADPLPIKEQFEKFASTLPQNPSRKITFDIEKQNGSVEERTVQDMRSMARYTCLIRADSALSRQAGVIGAPDIEIWPSDGGTIDATSTRITQATATRRKEGRWLGMTQIPCNAVRTFNRADLK